MKKRIFAVLAIVMIMVPLVALSVSADQYDVVTDDVVSSHIEGYIPDYASKTEYIKGLYVNNDNEQTALEFLVANDHILGSRLESAHTLFYTTGDRNNLLSDGDLLRLSRKYIRNMGEGYSDNVKLGTNVQWAIRYIGDNAYGSGMFCGVGDVYVTYNTDGTTDICLFDTTGKTYNRVQLIYSSNVEPNETESNGDMIDVLTFNRISCRSAVGGSTLNFNTIDIVDVAMSFSDEGYYANSYYLTKLLIPSKADPALQFSDFAYVAQGYEMYLDLRSAAIEGAKESMMVGIDHGYEFGYDEGLLTGYYKGEESGYDMGYYYGYYDGKDEGQQIGYEQGYGDGEEDGMRVGLNQGWADGHETGYIEGAQYSTDMGSMFFSILEAPIVLIDGMLNFDLFGINVAGLVKTLLTLSVTAVIVFFIFKLVKG